jgi:hypothetical protein
MPAQRPASFVLPWGWRRSHGLIAISNGGYLNTPSGASNQNAGPEHVLQPGYNCGDEFEFRLDLILDGLETKLRATT